MLRYNTLKWRGVERRSLCYVNVKSHFSRVGFALLHLVHTGHVSSRPATYGRHGNEPLDPSTSVCINAHEISRFLVAVAPCHQIPVILLGPIEKTVIPLGNQDLRGTCLDVTHCTWHVVTVKAPLEWINTI